MSTRWDTITERPEWGLSPLAPYLAAWGARAIWQDTGAGRPRLIDLLHDRQGAVGDANLLKGLQAWLNRTALKAIRADLHARGVEPNETREAIITEGRFTLRASPRGSCGYLYLIATVAPEGYDATR